jgi:hypothetical protein
MMQDAIEDYRSVDFAISYSLQQPSEQILESKL